MDWGIFAVYVGVGFLAQIIDGALGMAYGVSANSFLLALGLPPSLASACVHAAELFTTATSGISHRLFGNVDGRLFRRLVIPGVIGGALGAYILSSLPGNVLKPYVTAYLLIMGLVILARAIWGRNWHFRIWPIPLGAVGGLLDALGGGGWGPVVTTTLVASGEHPRQTVGSVNAAEFFVTTAESVMFVITLGSQMLQQWPVILGLLLGGVVAAPLAALVCKKLPPRVLMGLVGVLIVGLQVRTFVLMMR